MKSGLWDVADEEASRKWDETESPIDFANGAEWALGWTLAVAGMFQAIRDNPRTPLVIQRDYGTYDPTRYACFCPGCGAYMKHLRAGVDEGTDNEWCGSCRY